MSSRAKLAWRCRRGMRELDVVLSNFLEHGVDRLSDGERHDFERLLEQADHDILSWLTGRAPTPDESTARIVATIRSLSIQGVTE